MCNCLAVELWYIVEIFPRPKARSEWQKRGMAREQWQKIPRLVILNAVKNPTYSMNQSCSKADTSFTYSYLRTRSSFRM